MPNQETSYEKEIRKNYVYGNRAVIALISFSLGNMHRDNEAPILDLIRCKRLEVVDPFGLNGVVLTTDADGGKVDVFGKDGKGSARLFTDSYGGGVYIFNKAGENVGQLSVGNRGGGVLLTTDKHGYRTGSVP